MSVHSKGLTLEQLHAAWLRRNIKSGRWPGTFEAAMEDPLLSRILKIRALHVELATIRRGLNAPEPHPDWVRVVHSKPLPEPDRRAYWMDTQDPADDS